jgi:DNA-binding FadR family transcriptional regulator
MQPSRAHRGGPEASSDLLPRATSSLVEELASRVQSRVLEEGLAPGARLGTKGDLARRYGVSTGTVNAALRLLDAQGVAQSRPGVGGGVFVSGARPHLRLASVLLELRKGSDQARVEQVFDARLNLEVLLTRLAASVRVDDDMQALRDALALLIAARDNPAIYTRRDWDLHARIAQAAHDPILLAIYRTLMGILRDEVIEVAPSTARPDTATSIRLHEQLVEAVIAGDADGATRLAEQHVARLRRGPPGLPNQRSRAVVG